MRQNMGKLKRMDQVRSIIETYLCTRSIKATARRLVISKNTVRCYLRRAKTYSKDLTKVLELSEEDVTKVFYLVDGKEPADRELLFASKISYWIKELRRVGVTKHLLWEEYRNEYPGGYGRSQFCERLKREIGRRDLTLSLDHTPGKFIQVDFAGSKMCWIDAKTGEVHECEVLITVMPHSHFTFAIALPSQKVADFVHGLNQALLFYTKLPKAILSDNLKSYVTKADRYDPEFNELCVQLSTHYGIDLTATRVGKPRDKASVENMVKTAYSRIYAPLRDEIYHSLEELNEAIRAELIKHNMEPYQKKQGCRHDIFQQYELPVMQDLPSDLFEIKRITKSKVRRDYHVFIGEEKNYYSVPFQYVGKNTIVVYTSKLVEVYLDNQRIAVHDRLISRNAYRHQTNDAHMPKSHSEWKKARGFNAAYFLKLADQIGPATYWVISQVLISRIHEAQSYNSCKGIFHLGEKYSIQRLELACLRCQKVGKASYSILKRILQHNLDQVADQPDLFNIPQHDNIRGSDAYQ